MSTGLNAIINLGIPLWCNISYSFVKEKQNYSNKISVMRRESVSYPYTAVSIGQNMNAFFSFLVLRLVSEALFSTKFLKSQHGILIKILS